MTVAKKLPLLVRTAPVGVLLLGVLLRGIRIVYASANFASVNTVPRRWRQVMVGVLVGA